MLSENWQDQRGLTVITSTRYNAAGKLGQDRSNVMFVMKEYRSGFNILRLDGKLAIGLSEAYILLIRYNAAGKLADVSSEYPGSQDPFWG